MCPKPDIPEPEKFQASKAPVFSSSAQGSQGTQRPRTGRRATLLASPAMDTAPSARGKTLLGQ